VTALVASSSQRGILVMRNVERAVTGATSRSGPRRLRQRPGLLLALALAGLTAACASDQPAPVASTRTSTLGKPPPGYKVGQPYQINGVWYYPRTDWNYDETGIASWYGEEFHGRNTANGEIYDLNGLTAAHKTLQMPVNVRVTNLENGRSVVLRVNDRGPFVNNRIIDVSRRSAQLLGFEGQGTARVRVQVIPPPGGAPTPGAPTFVAAKPVTTDEERTAAAAAPVGQVAAATLPPPPGVRQAPTPATARPAVPKSAPAQTPVAAIPTPTAGAVAAAKLPEKVTVVPVRSTQIFVQAGAFTRFDNANRLQAQLRGLGPTSVSQFARDGMTFFRVRIGPLKSVDDADTLLDRVIANGQTTARIVVE
jgi:rare lipoprotein A